MSKPVFKVLEKYIEARDVTEEGDRRGTFYCLADIVNFIEMRVSDKQNTYHPAYTDKRQIILPRELDNFCVYDLYIDYDPNVYYEYSRMKYEHPGEIWYMYLGIRDTTSEDVENFIKLLQDDLLYLHHKVTLSYINYLEREIDEK